MKARHRKPITHTVHRIRMGKDFDFTALGMPLMDVVKPNCFKVSMIHSAKQVNRNIKGFRKRWECMYSPYGFPLRRRFFYQCRYLKLAIQARHHTGKSWLMSPIMHWVLDSPGHQDPRYWYYMKYTYFYASSKQVSNYVVYSILWPGPFSLTFFNCISGKISVKSFKYWYKHQVFIIQEKRRSAPKFNSVAIFLDGHNEPSWDAIFALKWHLKSKKIILIITCV